MLFIVIVIKVPLRIKIPCFKKNLKINKNAQVVKFHIYT